MILDVRAAVSEEMNKRKADWDIWFSKHSEITVEMDEAGNITKVVFPSHAVSTEFCIINGKVKLLRYWLPDENTPVTFNPTDPIYSILDNLEELYMS